MMLKKIEYWLKKTNDLKKPSNISNVRWFFVVVFDMIYYGKHEVVKAQTNQNKKYVFRRNFGLHIAFLINIILLSLLLTGCFMILFGMIFLMILVV